MTSMIVRSRTVRLMLTMTGLLGLAACQPSYQQDYDPQQGYPQQGYNQQQQPYYPRGYYQQQPAAPQQGYYPQQLRWSPLVGQFDGLVKLGPGCCQAANLVVSSAPYASSGVCPPSPLWGRPALK